MWINSKYFLVLIKQLENVFRILKCVYNEYCYEIHKYQIQREFEILTNTAFFSECNKLDLKFRFEFRI